MGEGWRKKIDIRMALKKIVILIGTPANSFTDSYFMSGRKIF